MNKSVENAVANFDIQGDFLSAAPYGSGHINDTYAVNMDEGGREVRYILQRINHNIFKDVPALMDNIVRVTKHIRAKLEDAGGDDIDRKVLTVIPTREGGDYYLDGDGNYWRMYVFIEKAKTYDFLESLDQAYEAARSFGNFQSLLVDLPEPALHETIVDFHNGLKRYQAFEDAFAADAFNRAAGAEKEIDFLRGHKYILDSLCGLVDSGKVPVRITHNDTKINNVMLDDKTQAGICVIDLDTVMPGAALYDFGDIVRTTVSPTAEDEKDLSKIFVDMPKFEAITKGYLSTAGGFLNQAEKDSLVLCGEYITLVIGTRFLTDYLAGDTYFKIHREGHNLDRCRTQFRLVECLCEGEEKLVGMVNDIAEQYRQE